jgi:hypothetical protein
MVCAYGGPALTIQDDGTVLVDGYGAITRNWFPHVDDWRDLISRNAAKYEVPEAWIASVICQESQGLANATAADGGTGLMQLTASQLFHGHPRSDGYDPEFNVDSGTQYLRTLCDKYNWNPVHVAAGYNAGGLYQWSGKNCGSPGLWNLNTACSYCENIVKGINTAIARGYSGTGVTGTSVSVSKALGVIAIAALPVAGFVLARRWL